MRWTSFRFVSGLEKVEDGHEVKTEESCLDLSSATGFEDPHRACPDACRFVGPSWADASWHNKQSSWQGALPVTSTASPNSCLLAPTLKPCPLLVLRSSSPRNVLGLTVVNLTQEHVPGLCQNQHIDRG